jgi:hypothetical protein
VAAPRAALDAGAAQLSLGLVRAELVARGATGRCGITVRAGHDHEPRTCVEVAVRIGLLRATFRVNAGTVRYALPREVIVALGERATSMTDEVRRTVTDARKKGAK